MSEFTGERVIPGQVEDDLWAEHIARYAFAARFAAGKRVLDVGCGTGYGTAELAKSAAEATGVDISSDAIDYAASHYSAVRFALHSAAELPFADGSFDLITSFELIEHLSDWRGLLQQARRVLQPAGLFIVSTPNKSYYAEARGKSGPNPFHEHEFEYDEFRAALGEFFPHVKLLLQDRLESFGFYAAGDDQRGEAQIVRASGAAAEANFFVAICSGQPLAEIAPFVYVPSAANLLRERETHIRKLEGELTEVRRWLAQTTAARDELLTKNGELQRYLEEQNQWALRLEGLLQAAQIRVTDLQDENARQQSEAQTVITGLSEEHQKATEWALDVERKLQAKAAELAATVTLLDTAEAAVVERTQWAQQLNAELEALRARMEMLRQSRWIKLGRTVGLGPELER
ncbi:MAG: methyltransferase domain-containing protein [Acidobacteriota bacterium]